MLHLHANVKLSENFGSWPCKCFYIYITPNEAKSFNINCDISVVLL